MSSVKFYTQRTVNGGKGLDSIQEVIARLKKMTTNKKSAYYKHLQAGRVQVHFISGSYTPKWDIVVLYEHDPEGLSSCGNCSESYLDLDNDYLCDTCRSLTD